ncbi:hypothetical protein N0V85_003024 [Neurospora sp. IMI 360204]|nr:hypothetical protein N0V85_003024 [Neurospora sp. IMI 360204]
MERPTKRSRTGPTPFDDEEVVGDELNHQPEEVNQLRDPGYQLEKARSYAAFKLKSAFENIFEKYGKDFDGIGDEIDLRTGEIVVDNGHIKSLKTATIGVENDDDDESESESGNEEETISHGQESKQDATALQTVPRPLPSMAPPSAFGAFGPGYNSFGGPPSAFGGFGPGYNSFPEGPPPLSNTMYPVQTPFQSFPMPFGAFSSANASIDPAWRAPDLPPPVPWGGFWTPGTQSRVKTVAKVQQLIAGTNRDQGGEDEDDILLDVSTTETTRATEHTSVITKKLAPFQQNADLLGANLVKSAPVPPAKESVAELEFETRPIVEHEPSVEKGSDQSSVEKSRVEAPVVEEVSPREQDCREPSTNPSANDSNQSALAPTVEQPLVGTELVVGIQSSLTVQSGSGQSYVQETIAREPVVEETSIDEGPVAETEPPSAGGDGDQSASISATATKSVNHDLPGIRSSTDLRTARRKRRLSKRDQSSPAGAKRPLREQLASRYEQSLFNGETNANTTLKYYSPSRGTLITKPSNQQLWVEIPVDGTLDPKAFQVVVDDDTLIAEVPALEVGRETTNILAIEEMARDGVAKPQVPGGPETQTEAVEERSPSSNDQPHEVFTRNVVDSAYAFSDEDEPAIPKARVRGNEPIQPNPKPKAAEKSNVKEFGIPTPASSFDRNSQTTESQATSQAEIPMDEPPVISAIVTTEIARLTQSADSVVLDKTNTNTNTEELPSLPEPVQVIKHRRGRPGRKPKTPIDLSETISPVVTSTSAVTEKPSELVPIITALAPTRSKRQSLRLSRGRRDSDITIPESTTPHTTVRALPQEDVSIVIQESPQGTPEPEAEPVDELGRPASPTLTATIPASPRLAETSAPDQELPDDSLLEEAIARQRFWSPKPESIILGHEPSPPGPRAETILEVVIPSKRMPPTSASPPPQEQEHITKDIQPQQQPEQPTTPLKTRPRGRPASATSLPTATITTTTKVKTKAGSGSGSGSRTGLGPSRRTTQTPSTATRITTAPTTSSRKKALTSTLQKQSKVQTPGTSKSTKSTTKSLLAGGNTSILSLISSDTDDEDELTLDFGTPSGNPLRRSVSTTTTKKIAATSTTPSALLLLRTPSRKPPPSAQQTGQKRKTTSLAKIASSISVGRLATPASRSGGAVTPPTGGSETGDFVGSEVIQTPGGTLRRCGEAGFRCDRDFCFGCL